VSLRYPNLEVRASLNGVLLQQLMQSGTQYGINVSRLHALLKVNNWAGMKEVFHQFFASIPYNWYTNSPLTQFEGYYASIFYSHFAALGLDIRLEDATNHGRIDMAVCFNANVYIFEFKVEELTPQGKALAQIKERNYADKYQARKEPIHLIGVEFSKATRNIVGFDVESMGTPS
jgi:hypothetical protein